MPVIEDTPPASDAAMPTPGAAMNTASLWLLNEATASPCAVAPTPTTLARPAG